MEAVAFFFVLSGFIITLIHRKDFEVPTRLFTYMRKRATRIYPSYIIIFTVVYLSAIALSSTRNTVPHDAVTLIKSVLLLPQDPNVVGGGGAPVIVVAWTLQYEMIFYSAIIFAIINRYLFAALILIFMANYVFCATQSLNSFPQSFFANDLIFLFLIGMLAAYMAKSSLDMNRPLFISIVASLAFLCLAVFEVVFFYSPQHLIYDKHHLTYGIISGVLIVGLVRTEDSQHKSGLVKTRFITLMGDASYALYLIHLPLISILCKLAIKVGLHGTYGASIAFAVIFMICIFAALAFYSYIERPILSKLSGTSYRSVFNNNASQKI